MAVQNIFEYKDLTPKELEKFTSLYGGKIQNFMRVGPKGYLLMKEYKKHEADIYNMQLRQGDVFVASYQRSGTTWTQELVWLLANNLDYEKAAAVPLTQRYSFLEFSSYFDEMSIKRSLELAGTSENFQEMLGSMTTPATKVLFAMPSPRFVKTHLPMSFLPPAILETAKVVYVARDPRDVAVSSYHHARLIKMYQIKASFKEMWNAFRKDLFILTPYFEHVKEAWALREHPNMLFLFYEAMSKDLPASIRRIADFLGKDLTPEQMDRLCDHLSIDNFKNNKSVNNEELREFGFLDSNEKFVRKGKAGGWKEYFDEEMQRDAERWITDNLKDTDLRFPSMNN